MGTVSFDIGALTGAAGQYDEAGAQAASAGQQLGSAAVSGSAFGSQTAGGALASALSAFGQQHASGAAKIAEAQAIFAGRLRGAAAIGEQSIDLTSEAAAT
ncbi:hypothetical protein EK0264_05615 [Epidermidibacterium keratini]|uniref:ESX-1 secretion-associated protein n=1 Tax=Epidermidibacterium keratini TaxID=1891644 RepID=A0A7L4YLV3_9ACTN|nr:hypothetical protein [Epidermidibacterium keratini]QHB99808.1 hypothetical protein EK0264_05615 [Epidermidibacterium keratini]